MRTWALCLFFYLVCSNPLPRFLCRWVIPCCFYRSMPNPMQSYSALIMCVFIDFRFSLLFSTVLCYTHLRAYTQTLSSALSLSPSLYLSLSLSHTHRERERETCTHAYTFLYSEAQLRNYQSENSGNVQIEWKGPKSVLHHRQSRVAMLIHPMWIIVEVNKSEMGWEVVSLHQFLCCCFCGC